MCFGAIIHARIQRLVFAAPEPKAGALTSHAHLAHSSIYNHRFELTTGVLEAESAALLKAFFKRRREEKKRDKLSLRHQKNLN